MKFQKYINTSEVVKLTNRSYDEIISLVKSGELPSHRNRRGHFRLNVDAVEKYFDIQINKPEESGGSKKNSDTMTITEFRNKCREQQGMFRVMIGEPMGVGPLRSSSKKQISMLANGEKTGKNFVDKFTFNYAKSRVKNLQPHETIDEYRLFNNMLSSQPMAFNLFCPFIQMMEEGKDDIVTSVFKAIFPDKHIGEVTEVGLEYLHTDIKNYLNDCTAMDAIVRYNDTDGKPAFIAIETKYTDVLGENTSNKERAQDRYREWIKRIGMFKPETEAKLLSGEKVITQIYRNFLLTECYGIVEGANRCYSVVLAPALHPTTEMEVASLKDELLPEYQYKISSLTLEDFVKNALKTCPKGNKYPFWYFRERYENQLNNL